MFLITTPIEETWKTNKKILFLGEWCKIYSRKNIWSKLDYNVLPYHWDNRDKYFNDHKKLEVVYEEYLKRISIILNEYHKCDYPVRYWRIIIGFWLLYLINILFDRYSSIKSAKSYIKIDSTIIIKSDFKNWVPVNYIDFRNQFRSDDWNHFIYSKVIEFFDEIPYQSIVLGKSLNKVNIKKESIYKKFIKKTYLLYRNFHIKLNNKVAFVDHNFSTYDILKLQLSLGQLPLPDYYTSLETESSSIDLEFRNSKKLNSKETPFYQFLDSIVLKLIPSAYLEDFYAIKSKIFEYYPKNISAIYTSSSYAGNEGFKIWAAEKTNTGTKLVIGPHGGGFGNSLFDQSLDHQINISDRYFSWGWSTKNKQNKVIPLPAEKLVSIEKKLHPSPRGDILIVCASFPRYFYYMGSYPIAGQFLKYIEDQLSFLGSLSTEVKSLTKIRLHTQRKGLGWNFKLRIEDNGFKSLIDTSKNHMYDRINQSRLCIATYNATVFLETLSANIPTILFWNPSHSENNKVAKSYFDELRDVGILHDSPISAAKVVNDIYAEPSIWWNQPKIQVAVRRFCKKYAYVGDDWIGEWKKELKSITD